MRLASIRRGIRLLAAFGLGVLGLMLMLMGVVGIAHCASPPYCSEDGAGMASSWLFFGFLILLGAGRMALRRRPSAVVRHSPAPQAQPRFKLLRNVGWVALAAVLAPVGVFAAMMLGPALLAISRGSAAERSEGIVMALVGAPLALACFLGVRWIQQRTEQLKSGP